MATMFVSCWSPVVKRLAPPRLHYPLSGCRPSAVDAVPAKEPAETIFNGEALELGAGQGFSSRTAVVAWSATTDKTVFAMCYGLETCTICGELTTDVTDEGCISGVISVKIGGKMSMANQVYDISGFFYQDGMGLSKTKRAWTET